MTFIIQIALGVSIGILIAFLIFRYYECFIDFSISIFATIFSKNFIVYSLATLVAIAGLVFIATNLDKTADIMTVSNLVGFIVISFFLLIICGQFVLLENVLKRLPSISKIYEKYETVRIIVIFFVLIAEAAILIIILDTSLK